MNKKEIIVGSEGYFDMPNELRYGLWKEVTEKSDEEYIEAIFSYVMANKIPEGASLIAIEHKVGAPTRQGVEENIKAVREILRRDWPEGKVAIAPFLFCLEVLDEMDPHQRSLGLKIDKRFFEQGGLIETVLLCGDKLSSGIKMAVDWADERGIEVACDNLDIVPQLDFYRKERG